MRDKLRHWNPDDAAATLELAVIGWGLMSLDQKTPFENKKYSAEVDKMMQKFYNIKWNDEETKDDVIQFLATLVHIKKWGGD